MKKDYIQPHLDWFHLMQNDVLTDSAYEKGQTEYMIIDGVMCKKVGDNWVPCAPGEGPQG